MVVAGLFKWYGFCLTPQRTHVPSFRSWLGLVFSRKGGLHFFSVSLSLHVITDTPQNLVRGISAKLQFCTNKSLLQEERECESMNIDCLFCPDKLKGNRFKISEHLYHEHSFTLGHPDNLVIPFLKFLSPTLAFLKINNIITILYNITPVYMGFLT